VLSPIVYTILHLAATGISRSGEPAASWSDEVSVDSIGSRQSKAVRGTFRGCYSSGESKRQGAYRFWRMLFHLDKCKCIII